MARKLSRRKFLTGAGAGAAGLLLAACQPKTVIVEKEVEKTVIVEKEVEKVVKETVIVAGTPKVVEKKVTEIVQEVVTATPPPATPPPVDTGPLKIMWVAQVALVENFQKYSEEVFGPANNGAKVEFIIVPGGEFGQKLLSGIAAGDPPDMFRSVNHMEFSQFAGGGVLFPLDDLIDRDGYQEHLDRFLPYSLETGQFNGKQYGIPLGAHPGPWYLFHNKTALAEKGFEINDFDWTWNDYAQIAREMTDPENDIYGSWLRCNQAGYVVGVRSMGGDIIDATGTKSLVASEAARRWWEFQYKCYREWECTMPCNLGNWRGVFPAGKVVMASDNGYRESFLRETVEDFEWDVFVTPNEGDLPRGSLNADHCPITSASNHIDLAWEWLKGSLTVEQGILRVQNAQWIPLPIPEALLPEQFEVSPQYEFYIRQWMADPPVPMRLPANGRSAELYHSIVQYGFDPAWVGSEPLDEVIESIDEQVQNLLDKPPL